MLQRIQQFLSVDDLWSVLGLVLIVTITQVVSKPAMALPLAFLLASGMLAVFWLASPAVRARNSERHPNSRVVFWGLIAVVSAVLASR